MLPYLALSLAMLLWASSFIALKYVFSVFDPMVVLFARMVIATLCLLPLMLRPGVRRRYQKGDWKWLAALALAEPCLYFLLEARALVYTSASQAGVITATLPLLTSLGALLFLKERLGRTVWLGIAVSFAGVLWLTLTGEQSADAPNPLLGNALEFLAMVCATGYILIAKKLSVRYSALVITAAQTVLGMLWFGVLLFTPWVTLPQTLPLWPSLWVLYLGAGITLGAYGLYTWSVSRVPVAMAGAFVNLIPVFTVLLAWVILGETLSAQQQLACLLVFGGVLISQRKPAKARVQTTQA
jgi:drug/metabolite transporter (DMT)-like permease